MVVLVREVDPVLQRLLGGPLERHVEREPERVAGRRLLPRLDRAHLPAERVDADLREPGTPAQVRVVGRLDPRLADAVAGAVAVLRSCFSSSGEISPV